MQTKTQLHLDALTTTDEIALNQFGTVYGETFSYLGLKA